MRIGAICILWFALAATASAVDFYTDRWELGYDPNGDPYPTQGWDAQGDPLETEITKATPFAQNDTTAVDLGKIYIAGWQIDPPNSLVIKVYDDRPYLLRDSWVDIRVRIYDYDPDGNIFIRTHKTVQGIHVKPGETRVPIAIHNEVGQVVHARIIKVRNKSPIKLFD